MNQVSRIDAWARPKVRSIPCNVDVGLETCFAPQSSVTLLSLDTVVQQAEGESLLAVPLGHDYLLLSNINYIAGIEQ